jgi:hypothetical protein
MIPDAIAVLAGIGEQRVPQRRLPYPATPQPRQDFPDAGGKHLIRNSVGCWPDHAQQRRYQRRAQFVVHASFD